MGDVTPIRRRAPRSGVAVELAPTPETVLREIFRQEAEKEAELKELRRKAALARELYAKKHCLLVLPSIDQLRRMFVQ